MKPTALALKRGLSSGLYQQTDLGLERRCSCCGDYWPADAEFFDRKGGWLTSTCKACFRETTGRTARGIYDKERQ